MTAHWKAETHFLSTTNENQNGGEGTSLLTSNLEPTWAEEILELALQ